VGQGTTNGPVRPDFYQDTLRKIGAWLDLISARTVTVRERPDGFVVRYHRQDIDAVFIQRHFTLDEIQTLQRGDLRVRRSVVRRVGRRLQGLTAEPGGYQDLFRALGYTLDQSGARDVCILEEEGTDQLVVLQNVSEEPAAEVLGLEDRERLRRAAQARRRPQSVQP
jgi:hypothetical protein